MSHRKDEHAREDRDEQHRTIAIETMRYAAKRLDMREGVISFELVDGVANAIRTDGQQAFYYADNGRGSTASDADDKCGMKGLLAYVADRVEAIVLDRCGEHGKLQAKVMRGAVYPEFVTPVGPRGRRSRRRQRRPGEEPLGR